MEWRNSRDPNSRGKIPPFFVHKRQEESLNSFWHFRPFLPLLLLLLREEEDLSSGTPRGEQERELT